MSLSERIIKILEEEGIGYRSNERTIYTKCPECGRDDKFSVLKDNGASICYRGSCSFGKKWFTDWIVATTGCTYKQAKDRLSNKTTHEENENLLSTLNFDAFSVDEAVKKTEQETLKPIEWPMFFTEEPSGEGLQYLKARGIGDIANKYHVRYSKEYRRVYFPIMMDGKCYGWQARAIDKVPDSERMRNNTGFRRESLVMFLDNVKQGGHVIICEGPVDALKFDKVGGAVATMGKVVTNKQLDLILSKNPQKVYLALDDDAANEMNSLIKKINLPLFKINIPFTAKERCAKINKKADFGECTFEECENAFLTAEKLDELSFFIYME